MRVYVLLLSLFICSISFGQKYEIYNTRGRLIGDTTVKISKTQLKRVTSVEDTIIGQMIGHIYYPEVEREAQITGTVYISFTINESDSLRNIQIVKGVNGGPGLNREALRVLKRVRLPEAKHTKLLKKDSIFCLLAYRFKLTGGSGTKGSFSNGTVIISESDISVPRPLDPIIQKWMDSVDVLLHGRWTELGDFKKAVGSWSWYYTRNKRYETTGSPYTDTFSVYRDIYPPNGCPHASDAYIPCNTSFSYFPGKKMIKDAPETIYLLDSGPLFYHVNGYDEYYSNGPGALLYTDKKTYYRGNNNAYVKSPDDTSEYYVFINNIETSHTTTLANFVIGETLKEFPKDTTHRDGGVLLAAKPVYVKNNWVSKFSNDSIEYLFFGLDSAKPFHKSDTVLLRIERNTFTNYSDNNRTLTYCKVCQYYPFSARQIEQFVEFHKYYGYSVVGYNIIEERFITGRSTGIFHKRYHDPKESDSVFRFMKKKKLYVKS